MSATATIFQNISIKFENQCEESVLLIAKSNKHAYTFAIGTPDARTVHSSCKLLKDLIGEQRLLDISSRPELCLSDRAIKDNTLVLSKHVVRNIFIGLADIKQQDVLACKGSLDERISHLIPCRTLPEFESLMMGKCPKIKEFAYDRPETSGKGLQGLTERVYLSMQHHFKIGQESDKESQMILDVEMLSSRLADREIQSGTVLHLKDGYYYADRVFIGGGAYVAIFCDFEDKKAPIIVCRGTAMRRSATGGLQSGINDILLEIGTMGVKTIWPQVLQYLLEKRVASVIVYGKSMGGAVAQALSILIEGVAKVKVKKLVTFCSVGVGNAINDHFKQEILQHRKTPFKIRVIRTKNDLFHSFGGVHIGEGTSTKACDIQVYYLGRSDQTNLTHSDKNWIWERARAHSQQTTLEPFRWEKVQSDKLHSHLRMGTELETARKVLAYIVHFATLTLLNGYSFSAFYQSEKNNYRKAKEEMRS